MNEADTCRKYVEPRLTEAGWDDEPHSFTEQQSLTDGRIVVMGDRPRRKTKKRADYILRYTRDFKIAVVEAKARYKSPGEGLQQAKDYAEMLGLKFAYATNGDGIIEFDYITGKESLLDSFPSPRELWDRYCLAKQIDDEQVKKRLITPYYHTPGKAPRYYQEIAINQSIESILQGRKRTLLTMATGTGKTFVAFQICWKLWEAGWNARGERRRPRILYLADRNILIDDPKDKTFTPFGDARWKIENVDPVKSREMYFAIYQSLAKDERRPGLFREYQPDFFDLIIVDECHRGSARDESNWREILEYFAPAYQLGMTATPLRDDNRDTYAYFGDPIYTYSLRQGIEDGFLAPYRVHRIVTDVDAAGWRPSQGEKDRFGYEIPDGEYLTKDFERVIALRARTEAIAGHLAEFMRNTDRYAKTIVFCGPGARRRDAPGFEQPQFRSGGGASGLRLPGDGGRGGYWDRPLEQFSGAGEDDAGDPDHIQAALHRGGRAHLQEHRPGQGYRIHDRVQADHRTGNQGEDGPIPLFDGDRVAAKKEAAKVTWRGRAKDDRTLDRHRTRTESSCG